MNLALLPSNSTDLSLSVSVLALSPSPTVTPSSVASLSSAASTNVALPADSGIGSAPSAFLSSVIVDLLSSTTR